MTGSHDQDIVSDILLERFNIDITQTLIYGDAKMGSYEPSYDGLRGMPNAVKVIVHDPKREILQLEKSIDKKDQLIEIWEDAPECHPYQSLNDAIEISNVCPCNTCIKQKKEELQKDAIEGGRNPLILDDSDISEEDRIHMDTRSRSSSLQETERVRNSTSPDLLSSSPPQYEEEQAMEDLNWDIESIAEEESSDEEDMSEERVWTNRARHPLPRSTLLNTTLPTKISRMPSDEEWARAAKRMRMMR